MDVDQGSGRLLTARSYLRVSLDPSGRMRSTGEQDAENARAAEVNGWELLDSYAEAGAVSASRYGRKARDGFARLVDDLEADRFGADVLILWEASRGSRRLSEWARFLELLEERGVRLHITSHGRTYDLRNPRDRRSLGEDGVDSEYESAKLSLRLRRAAASSAAQGLPNGPVPYGYRRRYDERTRRLVAQEIVEEQAANVREMFDRFVAGHSLRSIAADMRQRGVTGFRGVPCSTQVLRGMLQRRAYIGERVHSGKVVAEGQWPAIIDRSVFLAAQRVFEQRKTNRVPVRPGRAVHLLSIMAPAVVCDACDAPLAWTRRAYGGKKNRKPSGQPLPQYQCHWGGHVLIDADALDTLVTQAVLVYLAQPDYATDLLADDDDRNTELETARARVEEVRGELDDLAARVGTGEVSAALAATAEPMIQRRLDEAQRTVDELTTPARLRDLIQPGPEIAHCWETVPLSTRREILRVVCVPGLLGQVRVQRRPNRGSRPCPVEQRTRFSHEPL